MTLKILSVDDEPDLEVLISQKFRSKIRKGVYEFHFANNGLEALSKLVEVPDIDVILCDINMPEMDGITLLAKINELKSNSLKTIMVSAYGDMDNIRAAMNGGAFDFATKPIDFDDLEATIEKAVAQIEYIKKAEKAHRQLESIQNDLKVAMEIQQSILPKEFPAFPEYPQFDLYATMKAAKLVGGDFYDFFMVDDKNLGFIVADVSDKGIAAAIYMAVSRTIIRATALKGLPPNECLAYSNNLLSKDNANSMFVTVFYGVLNLDTGQVKFANAGHNPPCLIKSNGEANYTNITQDLVIGVFEDMPYSISEFTMQKGDSLFLFTDGVTEALDVNEELYTEARLKENLLNTQGLGPKEQVDKISLSVAEFARGAEQSDDITMMSILYKP